LPHTWTIPNSDHTDLQFVGSTFDKSVLLW
jgi:hypothetical protein